MSSQLAIDEVLFSPTRVLDTPRKRINKVRESARFVCAGAARDVTREHVDRIQNKKVPSCGVKAAFRVKRAIKRERLLRLSHVRTSSHMTDKTANRTARAEGQRKRNYFLWRCRLSSLRCLCLRIFFRRFLITLPNGCSPGSSCAVSEPSCGALERPRCRESRQECQGVARSTGARLEHCPLGQR